VCESLGTREVGSCHHLSLQIESFAIGLTSVWISIVAFFNVWSLLILLSFVRFRNFEIGHSHQPYNKVRFSEPRVVPLGQISDQFLDP
jgi:hypothetical protein